MKEPIEKKPDKKKEAISNKFVVNWNPEWPDPKVRQRLAEALSIHARRKLAQRMIRNQRKMVVSRKKARHKIAPEKNITIRAQRLARSIIRKRRAGKRGQDYKKLKMSARIAVDKAVEHGKGKEVIARLVKFLRPGIKRQEVDRARKGHMASKDTKRDERHKRKLHGRKH